MDATGRLSRTRRIYILRVNDEDRAQLRELLDRVRKIDAELERFRPLLNLLAPNGGGTDVQRAGLARAFRKAARNG